MARKSNKTAHVLNLLSGNDTKKEGAEEKEQADHTTGTHSASQGVSVIDTTESDPVADLIQSSLMSELEQTAPDTKPAAAALQREEIPAAPQQETAQAAPRQEEIPAVPQQETAQTAPQREEIPAVPQQETAQTPPLQDETPAVPPQQAVSQTPPQQDEIPAVPQQAATQTPPQQDVPPAAPQPEPVSPAPAPEPDFVTVNVMEEIVREKIIYFMRQFDVCTCDRCVADTIALTLNGLAPKYIVTPPAAVPPLLSFYTNKYIADVTVEATKACMVVGENPRH